MKPGRFTTPLSSSVRMPSRQERRKAERDAAKRKPGQAGARTAAGAAGAAGAAAALANLSVDPGGDWTTQAADPVAMLDALGAEVVKQKADAGDREAQWSLGCLLMAEASPTLSLSGAAGRSPQAKVGTLYLGRSPNRVVSMVTIIL